MLRAAISFFIIGVIGYFLGLNNVGGMSIDIGKMLLFIFVGLAVVSFLVTLVTGRNSKLLN